MTPRDGNLGQTEFMATYSVNKRAVAKARDLIDARKYRMRSRWAEVQPRAAEQNAFLKANGWAEYASWHLALTNGAPDETKARYAFVFGDFRRLHRMGLIACYYRAAEWEHTEACAPHTTFFSTSTSRERDYITLITGTARDASRRGNPSQLRSLSDELQ